MTATADRQTHIDALVAALDLETKVRLLTGEDFWTTKEVPEIGLRAMTLSDGPSGVRGPVWDERSPSLNLPSATALASSWDVALAHEFGAAAASEARRKGVDWVLGPTINIHRSPLGGRHFECFSEDPALTGDLAFEYVRGLQDNGVAATPKHYVANDFETDRFTVDVVVDERTLREVYLAPFERAVEAGAWSIMSSYNSVNGVTMTENDLLRDPLRTEWGWDGVVVSDWTAVRSTAAANAEQDLEMPGPGVWGDALLRAVRAGDVEEAAIDRHVARLLLLADRVGALGGSHVQPVAALDGVEFVRRAAAEGSVLLSNAGLLPLDPQGLSRVAVIGHNADEARTQGGGSATVVPEHVVNPLDGLRQVLPGVDVVYSLGAIVQEGVGPLDPRRLTNPTTGGAGLTATFVAPDGTRIHSEDRFATSLTWFGGGEEYIASAAMLVLETIFTPAATEVRELGFATSMRGRVFVDDELLFEDQPKATGADLGAALLAPPSETRPVSLTADVPVRLRVEFDLGSSQFQVAGAIGLTFGTAPLSLDPTALIQEAAANAAASEIAIVVVGTNSRVESEGYDRDDLDLPGHQDDLVRAVAAANPNTIVVVNSGSPVLMPWRDEVAAILVGYFGGQEFGNAIADMLTGAVEPGGRLPTTWPASIEDVPVLDCTPTDEGKVAYSEGIHVGYRAWLKAGRKPAFPFGFGLGYTTWKIADVQCQVEGDEAVLTATATNTGTRAGKHVVQVYASRPGSTVDRPARWLVGFAVARAGAGEASEVSIRVPRRRFEHYADGWQVEPGGFALHVGGSVASTEADAEVTW
ncbi:glycosyl hydrolase [Tessaracoccus aquimaris]|uniref:Glycosyl hydrolase n=1 Tax=Tessaracoccus aquimaris TaxID=1332264 RepID=A0A1Q2CPF3_9ACTN|nr:glycoside hydrolase family 3 C-terminal domain-containing protein [Tessaracoccus aquimaris]AQP48007.1 glycosyl hydrolase [Tessaracoccus aquimaris]